MAASLAGLARYLPHNRFMKRVFQQTGVLNTWFYTLSRHSRWYRWRQSTEPDTQILQDSPRKKRPSGTRLQMK